MRFGRQSVIIVTVTTNPSVRDRYNKSTEVRTETTVTGCRFRPLSAKEKIELGDIVTDPWKCTAPPVAAAINAKAVDEMKVDGITYKIIGGARPFKDQAGRDWKVTIIGERMLG